MVYNEDLNTAAVTESFLGFIPEKNQSAQGVAKMIKDNIKEAGLDIAKCCGQGYDGATVMSGIHSGVQMLIQQESQMLYMFTVCVKY